MADDLIRAYDAGEMPFSIEQDISDRPDISDISEVTGQNKTKQDRTRHSPDRFPGNLSAEIAAYIGENTGTFTDADIDRQFGLTHRQDKKNRSHILKDLSIKNRAIKKDPRIAGRWHILSIEADWVDLANTTEEYFDLSLPLGLNDLVNLPPKCIIVLAGSSNAGKTALALATVKMNLSKQYPLLYLMSEMGPTEYKQRVSRIAGDLHEWGSRVRAASTTGNYAGLITHHNPDGLTIIDYLEEVEGEYYKIASDIRSIYDALGTGIALVCIQKHPKARVGRGGEGTTEKARLYLTLDTMTNSDDVAISALKVIKAKDYPDANPNGKELHLSIGRQGTEILPVSKWQFCNEAQREAWVKRYEQDIAAGRYIVPRLDKEPALEFQTDAGRIVRITENQMLKWQDEFEGVDVPTILGRMAVDSYSKPFIKDKGYFFQLANVLAKEAGK